MSNLGALYTGPAVDVSNFIEEHIDSLVKEYFTPDCGYVHASVLRAELKPTAELWFLFVTVPHISEPPIADTIEGFCTALRQRYGVVIAQRDRAGVPAPWVYMHGYTGPIGAPRRNVFLPALVFGSLAYAVYRYGKR